MEEELAKLIGQQMPLKTKTGGRHLDYIADVRPGVVILSTNPDGSGRKTVLAIDCIESFTTGGPEVAGGSAPNWKPQASG